MTPGVGYLTALQHDMVDAERGEAMAHGQAVVAGTDDDNVDAAHRPAPGGARLEGCHDGDHATTTDTSVGLVMMSNTAERFCDWATSASISSRLAFASMA